MSSVQSNDDLTPPPFTHEQVRSQQQDGAEWTDVEPATAEACKLTVLVGAQLERATGGALKAVEHRVVEGDALPRHALVFRLRARPTAVLDPMALGAKYVARGVVSCLIDRQKESGCWN